MFCYLRNHCLVENHWGRIFHRVVRVSTGCSILALPEQHERIVTAAGSASIAAAARVNIEYLARFAGLGCDIDILDPSIAARRLVSIEEDISNAFKS